MRGKTLVFLIIAVFLITALSVGFTSLKDKGEQENPFKAANYLYIWTFEIGKGTILSEAIEEVSNWVKVIRETKENKSVRLFLHHTGPELALYIFQEPKSWQSIIRCEEKMMAAMPDLINKPIWWSGHSDNVVAEIPLGLEKSQTMQKKTKSEGTNFLWICENEIGPGQTIQEAIEDHMEWAKAFWKTGEFKDIRLYSHYVSPRNALYFVIEPKNWQSFETGWAKGMEALPNFMKEPLKYGKHTDNILTEIIVK